MSVPTFLIDLLLNSGGGQLVRKTRAGEKSLARITDEVSYMSRNARIVVPGAPHHVTQRGNRKQNVFLDDIDRQQFLQFMLDYSHRFCLDILAYCLMPNHDHLICIPSSSDTLKLVFKPVHGCYAQFFNWHHSMSGRLWQGRFYSCPMDVPHLWAAIRYVELNPVRAGMVRRAEEYPWSSALAHSGLRSDPLLSPIPGFYGTVFGRWSDWLADSNNAASDEIIRKHTRTGRPAGDELFIDDLEARLGLRVRVQRRGRPRKK